MDTTVVVVRLEGHDDGTATLTVTGEEDVLTAMTLLIATVFAVADEEFDGADEPDFAETV